MNKLRSVITCLIFAMLVSLPWTGISAAEKSEVGKAQATARTEIWKAITGGKTGSATVAIMDQGVTVYAEGFGMADRERNIPVDKNTIFNIASISKVYCATAVMLLVDEGKVDLDKPVTVYLPEFTMPDKRYKDITVRMLLNHSSGLPGTIFPQAIGYEYSSNYTASVLETLAQSHLKHAPGEMAPYCNDGFTLAQMIVSRVSGKTYIDFLTERIFNPLSLKNTGPSVGQRREEKGMVAAKFYNAAGKKEPLETISVLGSGGLSASAKDLCKFADAFSTGGDGWLSKGALAEMKKRQPSGFTDKLRLPAFSFGLGWDFTEIPRFKAQEINMLGKSGGTSNYSSMLFTVPDKRISVAVIAAGPQSVAMNIADAIMEAYLIEKGHFVKEAKVVKIPPVAQSIPDELAAYGGYYSSGSHLLRVQIDLLEKTMKVFMLEDGQETKVKSAVYHDGYFHTQDDIYYFASMGDRHYFVQRLQGYGIDSVAAQKIEPVVPPQEMRVAVDGKRWLRRNAKAYDEREGLDTYVVTSRLIKAVPGYIEFLGPKKIETSATATPGIHAMRDLTELILFDKTAETWAWVSGTLYMPADSAKSMSSNDATVSIGTEGYNEWVKVKENSVLSFQIPEKGRLVVFDGSGKALYDNVVDSGGVYAPAGSFIEMAAEPGSSFRVIVQLP